MLLLLTLLPTSAAQIIPTTWLNSTFSQPKTSIWEHSINSYNSLLDQFDSEGDGGGWTAQNAWTSFAQWDDQEGSRTFYNAVKKAQNKLAADTKAGHWGIELVNQYNDDIGWAGLANVQAYESYGDKVYLDRAIGAYEFILGHGYVSQAVLDKGYLEGTKNPDNTIVKTCNGKSMKGGVYWVNGGNAPSDSLNAAAHSSVNAVSTGNFALLGTDLCRVTKDMKYCDTSYENMWWIDRQLKNDKGMIYDNIDGKSCQVTNWQFTYNQGLYFAIYAELGFLTSNDTAIGIAKEAIKVALSPAAPWNSDNGIISEGKGDATKSDDGIGFKSIMIRYLNRVLPWLDDSEIAEAVREYVNIQYYALSQLDSDDKTAPVRFGRNWQGPYTVSTRHAQIAALDVLNALKVNSDAAFAQEGNGAVMALSTGPRDAGANEAESISKATTSTTSSRAGTSPTGNVLAVVQSSSAKVTSTKVLTVTSGAAATGGANGCSGQTKKKRKTKRTKKKTLKRA